MDLARARYLVSREGRAALAEVTAEGLATADPNRLATTLRRSFAPPEAAALAEQLTLGGRATRLHGGPRQFLYTAEGLEMMTHPAVAARRALRLAGLEREVVDLTTGLGGDLRAITDGGIPCAGLERDPVHALLAAANSGAPVARGDAGRPPFDVVRLAVFLDPSRRTAGTRRFDPAAFSPGWDTCVAIATSAVAANIKAAPGIAEAYLPPGAEVEAIQFRASMREMSLWFGEGAMPGLRRAVLLPQGVSLESTDPAASPVPVAPGPVLFDPESCVTRAGVVSQLAYQVGARLMDPHVAYLSAEEPAFSPLAATFELLESLPFSLARLRDLLRSRRWRPEEIRRRAFPIEPDELRKLLGRLDGEPVTLLLTTLGGQRLVFICRRLFAPV